MAEVTRRLAKRITPKVNAIRFVLGTVLTVDPGEGCEVDLGGGITVDAVVSSTVGAVEVDQGVRLSVQGNTYMVESITDGDMPTDTTSYSAATGWSVQTFQCRRVGRMAMLVVIFTRTGAAITVPADGNITNATVLTITSSPLWPVGISAALSTGSTGPMVAGHANTSGDIQIDAVAPGVTIGTGQQLSLAGTWITPA